MRKVFSLLILVSLFSCGGSQKNFERKLQGGSIVTVKKGVFSGIDFLYTEKKAQKSILYKLYYECECGFDNKIALRKGLFAIQFNLISNEVGIDSFY